MRRQGKAALLFRRHYHEKHFLKWSGQKTAHQFLICNQMTWRPCWGSIQQNFFPKNLHENRVQFPEERNAFVLDHQHGRRDVTCKPAMGVDRVKQLDVNKSGRICSASPKIPSIWKWGSEDSEKGIKDDENMESPNILMSHVHISIHTTVDGRRSLDHLPLFRKN